jgi:hypothetical protein
MPAGACGFCHRMCDEQLSIECMGPCAARYHLGCVNIGTVERDFFIVDGVSIYKCHNCSRRRNSDVCVTPIASQWNVKAAKSSFLPTQDKHIENNLECSLVDKLNVLKENCDSMAVLMKEILNEIGQISTDLSVLKSENVALKCMLNEFLKENKSCSSVMSDSAVSLTKSAEKILKMEAHFNSGVSASDPKHKMKALLDIKTYQVKTVVEF